MSLTIGIDPGDSRWRIAILRGDSARIVSDKLGRTSFPAKVSFLMNGQVYVGHDSETYGYDDNTVSSPLTLAGLSYREIRQQGGKIGQRVKSLDGSVAFDCDRVYPTLDQVLSSLFAHAKAITEEFTGSDVVSAVIAVPEGSSGAKRAQIKRAAEMAGLTVKRLVNQNIAAMLGYRADLLTQSRNVAVIDMGASHTSATILDVGDGAITQINSYSSNRGVEYLIRKFAEMILRKIQTQYEVSLQSLGDTFLDGEIYDEARRVFERLSCEESTVFSVGMVWQIFRRVSVEVTREELEEATEELLRDLLGAVVAGSTMVSRVEFVGGGGNIPLAKHILTQMYRKQIEEHADIAPDAAVACGAAIRSGIMDGDIASTLVECTDYDLGTFVNNNEMDVMVPRGTPYPFRREKTYRFRAGTYFEKVYQWIGNESGQFKHESEPNLIVLAAQEVTLRGGSVTCIWIADSDGVPSFIAKDPATGAENLITNFNIEV